MLTPFPAATPLLVSAANTHAHARRLAFMFGFADSALPSIVLQAWDEVALACQLQASGRGHSSGDCGAGFPSAEAIVEVADLDSRHLHVHVEPVEMRARYRRI